MNNQRQTITLGTLLFLFVRLLNLGGLPIFNDESIYLHWGLELFRSGDWTLSVVINGKPPGHPLLLGLFQLLPLDPVIAGRLLSICFSLITYLVTLQLARELFPNRSRLPLIFLLTFTPLLLFFDRLALAESIITAFSTLILFYVVRFLKKPRVFIGLLLGIILATGWWIKSTILLTLFPIFASGFILFLKQKDLRATIIKSVLSAAALFALLIAPLRLHPLYTYMRLHEKDWVVNITNLNLAKLPLMLWLSNIHSVLSWFIIYLTPLVFVLALLGIWRFKDKNFTFLCLWIILPTIILIVTSTNFMSRYLVHLTPVMLLLTYGVMTTLPNKWRWLSLITPLTVALLGILLISSPQIFFSYAKILPKAGDDFTQYVAGWSSGYGVKEAALWIRNQALGKPTIVFVRADNGNPEDAMYVFLKDDKNIRVLPINYLAPLQKQALARKIPVDFYFVSRGNQLSGLENKTEQVAVFPKPLDKEFVGVYRVQ